MSSETDVADRLLSEARKKTAKQDSPKMGKVALIVGIIAVIVSPISILGWIFGAAAVGTGVVAVRRPVSMKRGKIESASPLTSSPRRTEPMRYTRRTTSRRSVS